MPQEVTLSEHAVISVFVTWKPPKGRFDHYTVKQANWCPHEQMKAAYFCLSLKHVLGDENQKYNGRMPLGSVSCTNLLVT